MTDGSFTAQQVLALEPVSPMRFRSVRNLDNMNGAAFGGQLIALALRAAALSGVTWPVHNCSAQFLKRVTLADPVEFEVEAIRNGGRYAMRRIAGIQNGKNVFDLLASFHMEEQGLSHQAGQMGDVPGPDDVPVFAFAQDFPIELRLVDPEPYLTGAGDKSQMICWFRMPSAAAITDANDHRCLVAMISDWWLALVPLLYHREETIAKQNIGVTATNHSAWFHAPARADEWLLCRTSSPWSGNRRALATATYFDRSGTQVATVMQELAMPSPIP